MFLRNELFVRQMEAIGVMEVTPSDNRLPLRLGDFATLTEALEYAAQGDTGINVYTGTGKL